MAAAERAISACGHVVVDMADFPAADLPAAELCRQRVRGCQVYLVFRAVERGHGDGVSVAGCVVRGLSGGLVLRGLVDGVTVAV